MHIENRNHIIWNHIMGSETEKAEKNESKGKRQYGIKKSFVPVQNLTSSEKLFVKDAFSGKHTFTHYTHPHTHTHTFTRSHTHEILIHRYIPTHSLKPIQVNIETHETHNHALELATFTHKEHTYNTHLHIHLLIIHILRLHA